MMFYTSAIFTALLTLVWYPNPGTSHNLVSHVAVEKQGLDPQLFRHLKSQRVKYTYGPTTVPSRLEEDGMQTAMSLVPLPCSNCFVTWIQADLEYEDGSYADADTGMWLHHTVFTMKNKHDGICPAMKRGQRFFASGNERTPVDLCGGGTMKSGYYISTNDSMLMVTELMNMLNVPRNASLTVTWEYVPASSASEFVGLTPYWLDIGGCGPSEQLAQSNSTFNYSSPRVTASFPGDIRMLGGHLHDGGTHIEIFRDGNPVCRMDASYDDSDSGQHINHISKCVNIGSVASGEEWFITAHYDTGLYPPMLTNDGELEPIMGIVLAYVDEEAPQRRDSSNTSRNGLKALAVGFIVVSAMAVLFLWLKGSGVRIYDCLYQTITGKLPSIKLPERDAWREQDQIPLIRDFRELDDA